MIGVADLLVLLSAWGPCDQCFERCDEANLDCDCDVDESDLAILPSVAAGSRELPSGAGLGVSLEEAWE